MSKNKFNSILVKESKEILRRENAEKNSEEIRRRFQVTKKKDYTLENVLRIFKDSIWGIIKFAAILLIVLLILILITSIVYPDLRIELQEKWRLIAERILAMWTF